MSTRAVIEVKDNKITHRIYCHGDGYPECLGVIIKEFTELAPLIDPNFPGNTAHEEMKKGYNPYKYVPNVAIEADKFAAALLGFLWKSQYTSAYLTDRDAREEITEDRTDIEHLYEVTLGGKAKPKVTWFVPRSKQRKFVRRSKRAFEEATK